MLNTERKINRSIRHKFIIIISSKKKINTTKFHYPWTFEKYVSSSVCKVKYILKNGSKKNPYKIYYNSNEFLKRNPEKQSIYPLFPSQWDFININKYSKLKEEKREGGEGGGGEEMKRSGWIAFFTVFVTVQRKNG